MESRYRHWCHGPRVCVVSRTWAAAAPGNCFTAARGTVVPDEFSPEVGTVSRPTPRGLENYGLVGSGAREPMRCPTAPPRILALIPVAIDPEAILPALLSAAGVRPERSPPNHRAKSGIGTTRGLGSRRIPGRRQTSPGYSRLARSPGCCGLSRKRTRRQARGRGCAA